jgi:hypothetical protein
MVLLVSRNDTAIFMIFMKRLGLSWRADFAYARVTEPQFISLKDSVDVDTFPDTLFSDDLITVPVPDLLVFSVSMVIAPFAQSVSALSTSYDVSHRFRGMLDERTAAAANARAEYGRFRPSDGSPRAPTVNEPEMAEKCAANVWTTNGPSKGPFHSY